MNYIKVQNIKKLAKERGKRVSRDFLFSLDSLVFEIVISACKIWDGHRNILRPEMIAKKFKVVPTTQGKIEKKHLSNAMANHLSEGGIRSLTEATGRSKVSIL